MFRITQRAKPPTIDVYQSDFIYVFKRPKRALKINNSDLPEWYER